MSSITIEKSPKKPQKENLVYKTILSNIDRHLKQIQPASPKVQEFKVVDQNKWQLHLSKADKAKIPSVGYRY